MGLIGLVALLTGCGRIGFEIFPADEFSPVRFDGGVDEPNVLLGTGGATGTGGAAAASQPGDAGTDMGTGGAGDVVLKDATVGDAAMGDATLADAAMVDAAISSAVCGDGRVEGPEECDDGGESAVCDADCTWASCGDRSLNPSAGEACDAGGASVTCTSRCQATNCRPGCSCENYAGARYMFCPDEVTWDGAQAECHGRGLSMVRITSGEEQTWLRYRTQTLGYPKFHVGASDVAQEALWVWDDGTQFWQGLSDGTPIAGEFSLWHSGEPNSFLGEEDCAEVDRLRGWNDSPCTQVKPFVCKDYRLSLGTCGNMTIDAGEACDAMGEDATCDADCTPALCGDGHVNVAAGEVCDDGGTGQSCSADCSAYLCPPGCDCFELSGESYTLCSAALSYQEAIVACGVQGGTLAPVYSASVGDELARRATQGGLGTFWLGGVDEGSEGEWQWTDFTPFWTGGQAGSTLSFSAFAAGEPSDAGGNCLASSETGAWFATPCANTLPFTCQRH